MFLRSCASGTPQWNTVPNAARICVEIYLVMIITVFPYCMAMKIMEDRDSNPPKVLYYVSSSP